MEKQWIVYEEKTNRIIRVVTCEESMVTMSGEWSNQYTFCTLEELLSENIRLREALEKITKAVNAQANDGSLWAVNMPGKPFCVGIGEAYIQQSLRWLHYVIEDGDDAAMNSIIEQSKEHALQAGEKESG